MSDNTLVSKWLSNALVVSQIVSLLAIPVVLALVGFGVQRSLQEQQIRRDYVQLAVSMLMPKKDGEKETSAELRSWAIDLLNDSSPVKLTADQVRSMSARGLSLRPGDLIFFTSRASRVSKVYLGDGQFLHRTPGSDVEIESLAPDERRSHEGGSQSDTPTPAR